MTYDDFVHARRDMILDQFKPNGIFDPAILRIFHELPRHDFVPISMRHQAYNRKSINLDYGQVMLSALTLATVTQALRLTRADRILEIGTGSGYLTAVLALLSGYVYSLECVPQLAETASERLHRLRIQNVDFHIGDGSQGLPDMASFDVIVVTASVTKIPKPLAKQLHPLRGRMVIPIGTRRQQCFKMLRREVTHWYARTITKVVVPPLLGRYGNRSSSASA